MASINKDDLTKIRKALAIEPHVSPVEAKIFFDGKQYNLRIPTKMAKTADVNPKKDRIMFMVNISADIKKKPELKAELVRG